MSTQTAVATAEPNPNALLELYKRAFANFVAVMRKQDSALVEELEHESLWPCEPCLQLHMVTGTVDEEAPTTCRGCTKTMCKYMFVNRYITAEGDESEYGWQELGMDCCKDCSEEYEWKNPMCLKCRCEGHGGGKFSIYCDCDAIVCPHEFAKKHTRCGDQSKKARTQM